MDAEKVNSSIEDAKNHYAGLDHMGMSPERLRPLDRSQTSWKRHVANMA